MRTWLDDYYEFFLAHYEDEINNQLTIAVALDAADQEEYQ